MLVSCWTHFWILKMKGICSSESSVDLQRTTRLYIPEDGSVRNNGSLCVRTGMSSHICEERFDLQIIEQSEAGCHCIRISHFFIAEARDCAQDVVTPLVIESS
jgi:glycine cleavage system H lipoate-binding protein